MVLTTIVASTSRPSGRSQLRSRLLPEWNLIRTMSFHGRVGRRMRTIKTDNETTMRYFEGTKDNLHGYSGEEDSVPIHSRFRKENQEAMNKRLTLEFVLCC
jgi:hypothetical protein